jgi:cytochrome P450
MVKHPHAAKKAQAELDRVVGRDRLPTWTDQGDLVYLRALIAECHRWRPVIAGGLPHRLDADDVYDSYFIPKGALCSLADRRH